MAVLRHADEAARRYEEAAFRVEEARRQPASPESLREWLSALSDLVLALAALERANQESVIEKLDLIGRFVGIDRFATFGRRRTSGGRRGRAPSRR